MKEEKDHGHSQQIKFNNFTVSLLVKRRENFTPIICHSIYLGFVNPLLDVALLIIIPHFLSSASLAHVVPMYDVISYLRLLFCLPRLLFPILGWHSPIILSSCNMTGPSPFWLFDFAQNVYNSSLLSGGSATLSCRYLTINCNLSIATKACLSLNWFQKCLIPFESFTSRGNEFQRNAPAVWMEWSLKDSVCLYSVSSFICLVWWLWILHVW